MSFQLVPKSVTLNDLERRNGRYFALFQRIRVPSGAHCIKVQTDPHTDTLIAICHTGPRGKVITNIKVI